MRLLPLLLVLAAGCGGNGPPSGKHGYASKAVEDWIKLRNGAAGSSIKCRLVAWGPSWEATPAHLAAMRRRNGGIWFGDTIFTQKMPPVAFAVETVMRTWPDGDPSKAMDARMLFLFGEAGTIVHVPTLGLGGAPQGDWLKFIPGDPDAVP